MELKFHSLPLLLASTSLLFPASIHASPATTKPAPGVQHPGASCATFVLPVPATANITQVSASNPDIKSNIDVVGWVTEMSRWSYNASAHITGTASISATYGIGAQLCVPTSGDKKEILQIATHGIGFDKRYWDSEVQPENYSYVRAALNAGYSILTYDRLGTGSSDRPDAATVQVPLQLEILASISRLARSGSVSQAARGHFTPALTSTTNLPNFTKIVQVGHSFGSILNTGLISKYPALADGALLTGYIYGAPHPATNAIISFGFQFARENNPKKYGDRPDGYIVVGTQASIQTGFFSQDRLDPHLLTYANDIKAPGTIGEWQTSVSAVGMPAPNYTKPLQYFLGEYDLLCSGDCTGAFNETIQRALYPRAEPLEAYIQPKTGHGTTLHINATAGYQVMLDFLDRNGL